MPRVHRPVYFGSETRKAQSNFHITGVRVDLLWVRAIALIKQVAVRANVRDGRIDASMGGAIETAAQEIIDQQWDDQFVTDAIQGGAGTSLHMNVNEVIAARASELLGGIRVHPLDHVNLSQSTNDVVPTALRLVMVRLIDEYIDALVGLEQVFAVQEDALRDVIKVGRTHLQDAVPMTMGREFGAYRALVARDRRRLQDVQKELYATNLGGTAIGTRLNASETYVKTANEELARRSGYPFFPAENMIDATQNVDQLIHVAYVLQLSALSLSKVANDLRLMASGPRAGLGEITVPELQKGSTIMAGKVNPIALEALNQAAYQVSGNAQVASLVLLNGQMELNVMLPVFGKTVIESLRVLTGAVGGVVPTIRELRVHRAHCRQVFDHSTVSATAFNTVLGYDRVAQIVQRALEAERSFTQEVLAEGVLTQAEIDAIIEKMVT